MNNLNYNRYDSFKPVCQSNHWWEPSWYPDHPVRALTPALGPHAIKVLCFQLVTGPFHDLCSPPTSGKSDFSFQPAGTWWNRGSLWTWRAGNLFQICQAFQHATRGLPSHLSGNKEFLHAVSVQPASPHYQYSFLISGCDVSESSFSVQSSCSCSSVRGVNSKKTASVRHTQSKWKATYSLQRQLFSPPHCSPTPNHELTLVSGRYITNPVKAMPVFHADVRGCPHFYTSNIN